MFGGSLGEEFDTEGRMTRCAPEPFEHDGEILGYDGLSLGQVKGQATTPKGRTVDSRGYTFMLRGVVPSCSKDLTVVHEGFGILSITNSSPHGDISYIVHDRACLITSSIVIQTNKALSVPLAVLPIVLS